METPTKLNFSPSSILIRLEQLKRWQIEQEERLKLRQQKHRELLSNEQRRMCEAFDLNVSKESLQVDNQDKNDNENVQNETDEIQILGSNLDSEDDVFRANDTKDTLNVTNCNNLEIVDDSSKKQIEGSSAVRSFDEIPIAQLKSNSQIEYNTGEMEVQRPKFKFLKRGEGLARYRMTKDDVTKNKQLASNRKNKNQSQKKPQSVKFQKKATIKRPELTWTTVPIDRNKNKSEPWIVGEEVTTKRSEPYPVISKSTYEKLLEELKSNRDKNELKTFELLEEKANHSSFCSTNSAVMQIVGPEQSTPKLERLLKTHLGIQNETTPRDELTHEEQRSKEKDEEMHVHFHDPNSTNDNTNVHFEDDSEWSESDSDVSEVEDAPNSNLPKSNQIRKEAGSNSGNNLLKNEESREHLLQTDSSLQNAIQTALESDEEITFKSELLKKRLLELENEIQTFRRENSNLVKRRQEYDFQKRKFLKEQAEKEKELEEEKLRIDKYLETEKRKLNKDKMVFEKYVKDLKNQPTRKEREEITNLKNQIKTLKEELKVKESKHGASQARFRTQIRTLEKELSAAKEEIAKLKKENKHLQSVEQRQRGISNTKVLHEINKNLSKMLPKALAEKQLKALEGKKISPKSKQVSKNIVIASDLSSSESDQAEGKTGMPNKSKESSSEKDESESESSDDEDKEPKLDPSRILHNLMYPSSSSHTYFPHYDRESDERQDKENKLNCANQIPPSERLHSERSKSSPFHFDSDNIEEAYERTFGHTRKSCPDQGLSTNPYSLTNKKSETTLSDGSKEVHYSNGNVKRVSPDGNMIKLTYYNGDLKETNLSTGVIKYFYAKTKTSHTTYPNGFELLEFANGQVEKRYKNGRIEVDFPNGYKKIVDDIGNETWLYADGTRVITRKNGDKIIELTNGQREIHNSNHKRREYPDGTVKILYPDGATETRYANGRIRIKDKLGKLLMDSGET